MNKKKTPPRTKRKLKTKPPGYHPRVVVKFHDYVEIPYVDKTEEYIEKYRLGPWKRLASEYPGITMKRMFTKLEPKKIQAIVDTATERDRKYRPPNFFTYFMVDCPPGEDPEGLAKMFRSWESVQNAYYDPPGSDPQIDPTDDPRWGSQGYLDPAPDGIDAEFAWPRGGGVGFAGGDGSGINIIDLEQGWTLNHEDLSAQGASLLSGTIANSSRYHGTAVLGEICAVDNTLGCIGIVPNVASINVVSYFGSNRPDAVFAAIANLSFGDILLLEAQLSITGWLKMPIEVLDAEFDAIRLATAVGIVVVAAAGNGENDLDTYTDSGGNSIFNRASVNFRDSGAIMVGASSSTVPHTRMGFSNFGSRIDCYGWGENVDTTDSNNTGSTTMYRTDFNGTSSASPIITGAAAIVQGIAEASLGYRFNPFQVRGILSDPDTGTASDDPAADLIGVMPDLRAIIEGDILGLTQDIYIRDNVGDVGDPHTGSISSSPDIIPVPAAVADPQSTYGEGSGTENDNMLGHEVELGQDNYIYVRVRNRGGSDANNVVATVYWSPPSTLVTPDLWTLIGSVTIPNVPVGELLTVSDAIVWPKAAIPAKGHYCLVGLIGNDQDPAPGLADMMNWTNFRNFIRENNNVTWKNFNVVDNEPDSGDPDKFVELPFLAPGAPDRARRMQLEIVARLPKGARIMLEGPLHIREFLNEKSPFVKIDRKRRMVRIPVNPRGKKIFGRALFPARFRMQLKLLVHIPKAFRKNRYSVYVRQLYKDVEVGRVTWVLAPRKRKRDIS